MFRQLRRPQAITDAVVAAVFGVLMLAITLPVVLGGTGISSAYGFLVAIVLSGLFAIALGLRRFSPALALLLAWVGAIVQMAVMLPPLPANIAILAVLYTTAAYGTVRVFWLGFASSIVGALLITVYLLLPSIVAGAGYVGSGIAGYIVTGATLFISAVLALMLSWTVGALVRTGVRARENADAQRRAEVRAATESERNRIARDMHDVVAHSLAVVIAQADGARYAAATAPEAASEALQTISTTARGALADVRMLLTQLRHNQYEGPQPTVADLGALYSQVRAAGIDLRVDVDPAPPGEPPAAVQLAVYRILQEALTNALRHGSGGTVEVSLAWLADRVEVRVRNGVAAPAEGHAADAAGAEPRSPGHGLIGMRERAQLIGGRLDTGVVDGTFTVTAILPIGVMV